MINGENIVTSTVQQRTVNLSGNNLGIQINKIFSFLQLANLANLVSEFSWDLTCRNNRRRKYGTTNKWYFVNKG